MTIEMPKNGRRPGGRNGTNYTDLELENRLNSCVEEGDILSIGMIEATNTALLTPQEEIEITKKVRDYYQLLAEVSKNKDDQISTDHSIEEKLREGQKARDRLVKANQRLIVNIAKRYMDKGVLLSDLCQEGNLGLMRAVKKFDPDRGFKFSTYATWWIRQSIQLGLSSQGKVVKVERREYGVMVRIRRAIADFMNINHREPTCSELAVKLGISEKKLDSLMTLDQQPLYLDRDVDNKNGDDYEYDSIEDTSVLPMDENFLQNSFLKERLLLALTNNLNDRKAQMMKYRYGLKDGEEHTLEATGKKFGVSRQRVEQIVREMKYNLIECEELKDLVGIF